MSNIGRFFRRKSPQISPSSLFAVARPKLKKCKRINERPGISPMQLNCNLMDDLACITKCVAKRQRIC